METKYKKKENYEDYSSGRVLYGVPGATNFSVKLADEIFQICNQYLSKNGSFGKYSIYDPLCGVGYSLTVLGLIHGPLIKKIFASDIDEKSLEFARKNLSLLSTSGIDYRITEIEKFIRKYEKSSHEESLKSARRIKENIKSFDITTDVFYFDILSAMNLPNQVSKVDIMIMDVPYGKLTNWSTSKSTVNPVQVILDKIKSRLSEVSIVAIVYDKKQEISYQGYTKIKSFKSPKRKIILLKPNF